MKEIKISKGELFRINSEYYVSTINYSCNTNLSRKELADRLIKEGSIVKTKP